jgi:hypothetical protein
MEESKDWHSKERHHETPAAHSVPQTKPLAEPRTLDSHPRALQQKVERGETIASASGKRNYQIVEQSRNREYQEASHVHA